MQPPAVPLESSLYIARNLKAAGYDIANVGDTEARFGPAFLRERTAESGVPYISANLAAAGSTRPLLDPYQIREVGGCRVGFIGLLDFPMPMPSEYAAQHLEILDPLTAAANWVPRLRRKCDFVVVLAYMQEPRARELAGKVPGIDLILCRGGRDIAAPEKVGTTVIAPAGQKSGHVAELSLVFGPDRVVTTFSGQVVALKELGPRDAAIDTEIKEMLDRQGRDRVARAQAEAARAQAQPAASGAQGSAPGAAPTPAIQSGTAVDAEAPGAMTPAPQAGGTSGGGGFMGAGACQKCHQAIYEQWSTDPHATAFKSLAQSEDWSKPDCLRCHTTGMGMVPSSSEGLPAPEFWNVQCEACHGQGGTHSARPDLSLGRVGDSVCLSCHTPKWSPNFNPAEARRRLAHGK